MGDKLRKILYMVVFFILSYILLDQTILIKIFDNFISNALIRNLLIYLIYIIILDIFCLFRIIRNREIIKSNFKITLIFSVIFSLCVPFDAIYKTNYKNFAVPFNVIIFLSVFASLILILSNFLYLLNTKKISKYKINSLVYFLIPFLAISIKWIKNFPALMSFDSYYQLEQIQNNTFNDVHPAAHTLFCKALLQIYNSPATIVFFQILFLSLGIWYIFRVFNKLGVSNKVMIGILTIWSCITTLQTTTCYLWKDVFYSISLLFVTVVLMKSLLLKEKIKIVDCIILALGLSGTVLFRHNGIVPFILIVISIIYLIYKFKDKLYSISIIVSLIIIIFTKTIVYDFYEVKPNDNGTKYAIFAKAVVSVVANDGNYNKEELEIIEDIMPIEVIKKNYNWSQGQDLLWNIDKEDSEYGFANTLVNKEEILIKIFFKLLPKNFFLMAYDVIGSAAIMWQIDFVRLNLFSIHMIYFIPIITCAVLLINKRKFNVLIPFIPCVGNILSIVIANISSEARYGYPTLVLVSSLIVYSYYFINKKEI